MSDFILSDQETKEIWHQACSQLQIELSEAVFNTWVVNNPVTRISLIEDTGAVCTITSPTAFHSTNLKKNLGQRLEERLSKILGRKVELAFNIGTPSFSNGIKTSAPASTPPTQSTSHQDGGSSPTDTGLTHSAQESHFSQTTQATLVPYQPGGTRRPQSPTIEDLFSRTSIASANLDRAKIAASQAGLRPDYTFETFAVSGTNEMAHAAATAVSNQPGTAYNPLFLYGGVGVGKTHLMHAVAHNIIDQNPAAKIIYCSGEEFTNEIVSAIQTKKALRFKDKYRGAQVLLIDDVQFIAGKNTVQEEFFHT